MSLDQVLEEYRQSLQAVLRNIEGLSLAQLTEHRIEGNWTPKDLLGHLASWSEVCLPPLKLLVETGHFSTDEIPDHDAWNAVEVARKQAKSLTEMVRELTAVHHELDHHARLLKEEQLNLILTLPWGETGTVANMLSGLAWHEREHTKSFFNNW